MARDPNNSQFASRLVSVCVSWIFAYCRYLVWPLSSDGRVKMCMARWAQHSRSSPLVVVSGLFVLSATDEDNTYMHSVSCLDPNPRFPPSSMPFMATLSIIYHSFMLYVLSSMLRASCTIILLYVLLLYVCGKAVPRKIVCTAAARRSSFCNIGSCSRALRDGRRQHRMVSAGIRTPNFPRPSRRSQ